MDQPNHEDELALDIKFALAQLKYRKPARYSLDDPDAADKYHRSVADAVVEHLRKSWEFRLRPPVQFVAP